MQVWDWNSPVGLSIFFVGMTLSLLLVSWTLKTLASIGAEDRRTRR